jgi:hypothetical protein
MKMLALVVMLLAAALPTRAAVYAGKLDLSLDPEPFGARAFTANEYAYGVQKRVWHLDADGHEEFRISAVVGASTSHGILGGATIVVPGGGLDQILSLANQVHDLPQTLVTVAAYAQYVKTGLTVLYDPARIQGIQPAFFGYEAAVAFGGNP